MEQDEISLSSLKNKLEEFENKKKSVVDDFVINSKESRDITAFELSSSTGKRVVYSTIYDKEIQDLKLKIKYKEDKTKVLNKSKIAERTSVVWYGDEKHNKIGKMDFIYYPLIPKEGLFLVGGDSEGFKSLNLIYLAMCLASGKPYWGYKAKQRYKVYLMDFENGRDRTKMRFEAIKKANGFTDEDLKGYFAWKSDKGYTIELNESSVNKKWEEDKEFIIDNKIEIVLMDSIMHPFGESELLSNNIRKIYKMFAPLMEQGINFIGIVEDNKSTNQYTDAHDTIKGSKTMVFKMDSGLQILRQPENRFLLRSIKTRDGSKKDTIEGMIEFEQNTDNPEILEAVKFTMIRSFNSDDRKALTITCADNLLETIKELNTKEFDFGDKAPVYITMKNKMFTRSIIYGAREYLLETGKITGISKGKYILN